MRDFRGDDLAAAADAIDGMPPELDNSPWSQYQGDRADTLSTWWNTDGAAAHNTWTGAINLAADTYSAAYVNNINTQLTATAAADRLNLETLVDLIQDLELGNAAAEETYAQTVAEAAEAYQVGTAGASRDLQVSLAQAEVLSAEGDEQGHDDAVAAALEAYNGALHGFEDSQGEHVNGLRGAFFAAGRAAAGALDSTVSSNLHAFELAAVDARRDWQVSVESILASLRHEDSVDELALVVSTADADHDLVMAQAGTLAQDLDDLATTNGSPWAGYDADSADAASAFLTDLAIANRDRAIAEAVARAGHDQARSSANQFRGEGDADAERERNQAEADARNDAEQEQAGLDIYREGSQIVIEPPPGYHFVAPDNRSLQLVPTDPSLTDATEPEENSHGQAMDRRVFSEEFSPGPEMSLNRNRFDNASGFVQELGLTPQAMKSTGLLNEWLHDMGAYCKDQAIQRRYNAETCANISNAGPLMASRLAFSAEADALMWELSGAVIDLEGTIMALRGHAIESYGFGVRHGHGRWGLTTAHMISRFSGANGMADAADNRDIDGHELNLSPAEQDRLYGDSLVQVLGTVEAGLGGIHGIQQAFRGASQARMVLQSESLPVLDDLVEHGRKAVDTPNSATGQIADQIAAPAQRLAGQIDEVARRRGLGLDPASGRYRLLEEQAALRLEQRVGRLRRDPSGTGDWLDSTGRSYDAVGPVPAAHIDIPSFINQVDRHLTNKQGLDKVVIDLTGFNSAQRSAIFDHLRTLDSSQLQRILIQRTK